MDNCIFCKIIEGTIQCTQIFKDEQCIVFNDMHPKDEIHCLIVPLTHIEKVSDISAEDEPLLGHLVITAKRVAAQMQLTGYKLQFNVGRSAGQDIFHVHLHLIGHKK